jgi:hypothetical protein
LSVPLQSLAGPHGSYLSFGATRPRAEAEHRALLEELLLRPKRKNFAQVRADIPNVGEDADFVRVDDPAERGNVFAKTGVRLLNPFSA